MSSITYLAHCDHSRYQKLIFCCKLEIHNNCRELQFFYYSLFSVKSLKNEVQGLSWVIKVIYYKKAICISIHNFWYEISVQYVVNVK